MWQLKTMFKQHQVYAAWANCKMHLASEMRNAKGKMNEITQNKTKKKCKTFSNKISNKSISICSRSPRWMKILLWKTCIRRVRHDVRLWRQKKKNAKKMRHTYTRILFAFFLSAKRAKRDPKPQEIIPSRVAGISALLAHVPACLPACSRSHA